MKIGFIGIGAMGMPMANNLLKANYTVYVSDLDPAKVEEMVKKGAIGCQNYSEMAPLCDVIFSSLPNAAFVEKVYAAPGGVFSLANKGTVIVDLSSVAPGTTEKMAKIAKEKGLSYVDAPVSGGVSGAQAGTLTIMVGAEPDIYERILPILKIIGKNVFHMGLPGTGDAIKLVNNLLLGCNMAALAEALVLGKKCGLSAAAMQEVIKVSSGRSYAFEAKMENFIMAEAFDGGFAVDLQYKDLGLAIDAAREVSLPLPMAAMAMQVFEAARAKGLNRQDISSIVKVWEDLTGTSIK